MLSLSRSKCTKYRCYIIRFKEAFLRTSLPHSFVYFLHTYSRANQAEKRKHFRPKFSYNRGVEDGFGVFVYNRMHNLSLDSQDDVNIGMKSKLTNLA